MSIAALAVLIALAVIAPLVAIAFIRYMSTRRK